MCVCLDFAYMSVDIARVRIRVCNISPAKYNRIFFHARIFITVNCVRTYQRITADSRGFYIMH